MERVVASLPREQPLAYAPCTFMKILIVEDDTHIRRLLAGVLAPLGPEIVECADGWGALDTYRTHRPDVVLMDIGMPGLDGITATAGLTSLDPDARVVMVTSYDDADLREAAAEAGASGYVLKEDLPSLLPLLERLAG